MSKLQLLHFVSEAGLNIPTLPRQRASCYYDAGLLREPLDVFTLDQAPRKRLDEAERQMGTEAVPVEAVLAGIQARLPLALTDFLNALGIPGTRAVEMKALVERVETFEGLLRLTEQDADELPPGADPAHWRQMIAFLTTERHQQKLREFGARVQIGAGTIREPRIAVRETMRPRILIVGAGLCGGYLARQLLRTMPECEIRILEAGEEPGGRMLSHQVPGLKWALDFGAARFHRRRHPRLAALVEEYCIPTEPFSTGCAAQQCRHDGASAPLTLLHRALASTDKTLWSRTPMLEYCHERLSPAEIGRLVSTQGYDILLNPRLPASEVMRILDDHPETSGENAAWMRIPLGFQETVQRLCGEVNRRGGSFRFRTQVASIERLASGRLRVLCTDAHTEEADRVILTTPQHALEKIELPIDAARKRDIQSVESVPLMKAFFVFSESWWQRMGMADDTFLISDGLLRKLYFRPRHLVIYNDSSTARYWEPLCDARAVSSGLLWQTMRRLLHEALAIPAGVDIPMPTHHFAKYWPAGVYFWKMGAVPSQVQQNLFATEDTLHICSEAYSGQSGWGEAALSSADLLLEKILAPEKCGGSLRCVHASL